MDELLHVALPEDLDRALSNGDGRYRAASLSREGFLHCCNRAQLPGVLRRWFTAGQQLVLLRIDADALDVPIVRENTQGGDEAFPHVYGSVATDAIVERLRFRSPDSPLSGPVRR